MNRRPRRNLALLVLVFVGRVKESGEDGSRVTPTGVLVGTPRNMAVEVIGALVGGRWA